MKRIFTQTFGIVGGILEKDGKVLLVKEVKEEARGQWSHPAGWIDVGENPVVAVKREIREETGLDFEPTNILGLYSLFKKDTNKRFGYTPHPIKIIFIGRILSKKAVKLHDDVSETKWFTPEEIYEMDINTLRDLDIKKMVKDYFSGKRYPLELLTHTISD